MQNLLKKHYLKNSLIDFFLYIINFFLFKLFKFKPFYSSLDAKKKINKNLYKFF